MCVQIDEQWFRVEHLKCVLRVVLPVGGEMQVTVRREAARKQANERRLQQPSLVVPFLRPRIREVNMDTRQRFRRNHVAHDIDRVVMHDTNVG